MGQDDVTRCMPGLSFCSNATVKEPGCSPAATVQPPTSSTGAMADETTPRHCTPGTTTTVRQRAEMGVPKGAGHTERRFADRSEPRW